jgi:hypothetical protein
MSTRTRPGLTRARSRGQGGGWDEWSAQYGPAWERTKAEYWRKAARRPWMRRRCFWCRRRGRGVGFWSVQRSLQLNHLTYRWGVGDAPLIVLRPMCPTCHAIETKITRMVRPGMRRHRQAYAHAFVTYLGRWALYIPVWALIILVLVAR